MHYSCRKLSDYSFFPASNWKISVLGPNVTKHLIQKSDIVIRISIFLESKRIRESNGNVKFKVNMTNRKYWN